MQRSFPTLSGTIAVEGLGDDVTVQRDVLGIPTITADDTHDLFFAQGYVHAQDRFWEMDFRRHVTSGPRVGAVRRVAARHRQVPRARSAGARSPSRRSRPSTPPSAAYYDAYAEGVNAYLADHAGADASFEYAVLGLQNPDYEIEPWTPADSVAWLKAMAWDLRSNIEDETERAVAAPNFTSDQLAELYPDYPYDRNPVIVPTISSPARGRRRLRRRCRATMRGRDGVDRVV